MPKVYFATNRNLRKKKAEDPNEANPFGSKFHKDDTSLFRVGSAELVRGALEDPRSYAVKPGSIKIAPEKRANPNTGGGEVLGSSKIFEDLRTEMNKNKRDVIVFLHGFANNFEDSLRGAAQLSDLYTIDDCDDPGQAYHPYTFVFSWPSNGKVAPAWHYFLDRKDAAASGQAMARALRRLVDFLEIDDEGHRLRKRLGTDENDKRCRQKLHLVAHSMGAWALRHAVLAIRDLMNANRLPPIFENVFLMAPDEDADAFTKDHKMRHLAQLARAIHVYHSSSDHVLFISDTTKSNPDRLGTHGPESFTGVTTRIRTIDCSLVDNTSQLTDGNHQYFRFRSEVINDVRQVLSGSHPDLIKGRTVLEQGKRYLINPNG